MHIFKNRFWHCSSSEWIYKCDGSLQTMIGLVHRGNLLNQRQCKDLTSKLTTMHKNVHLVVQATGENHLGHALENYCRCLVKAEMLVTKCGEKEWWRAAAFQWQNENQFKEILLDASLCYNLIYVTMESLQKIDHPDDLRQSSVFEHVSESALREDEEHLIARLEQLIKDPGTIKSKHLTCPEELSRARALARFLKSRFVQKDQGIGIMWDNHMEYLGMWGEARDLKGTGSEFVKAVSTEWLGLRCFRKEFLADEDENVDENAVMKEASIMAHMKHPNIIQYFCHGNGQKPKCRFIGMELMEMSLFKLIEEQRGTPFPMKVTIDIIKQIARGMCYLHDQDVAHRDLKPQNVVIKKWESPDFEGYCDVKLVDFGISKTEVDDSKSNTITSLGIGTPKYWAPELHPSSKFYSKNKAKWFKADAYSFAMTCLHVLSLEPPFPDSKERMTSYEHYSKIMNGTLKPSLPTYCPESLKGLLEDCWHILPRERPTFVQICSRLALIHEQVQGWETIGDANDFVHKRIVSQSDHFKKLPKVILSKATQEDALIISCTCNHKLTRLQNPTSFYDGKPTCDICYPRRINGEVYHCSTCRFDAHPDCAEIRAEIHVFFHGHPLQLLTRNYYKNDSKAMCSLCEGSIQNSEWVYQCEQCEYDVHSLCAKFPNNKRWPNHEHVLTMRVCPPYKSLFCGRCNGEIQERTWHYYCGPCAFSMHLSCAFRSITPLCAFENSHQLILEYSSKIFDCALCNKQGYSQFYHCKHCNVDIHPYCVDHMDEETCNWNEAYEKVMMEKESKHVEVQITLISEILDKMSSYSDSKAKSSTQRPPSAVRKVHPPIHEPKTFNKSHENLDLANDVKLQRKMISTQMAERIKAKKLAMKKVREDALEMLENLEKILSNLRSIENVSEDEKKHIIDVHKRLKERLQLVKDDKAIQEESKLCPGPRIGVFFKLMMKDGRVMRELLIDLQGGMKDVDFCLLCEKPGHEHIVGKTSWFFMELDEKLVENLKPLLACGLQIVRNNITSTQDDPVGLESISIPNLDGGEVWDLIAINKIRGMENMEVLLQAAVSSSEWFLKTNEMAGNNLKETFGLHRIRYKVTDESNPPCYKIGSLAWLCKDHFDDGLEDGILECCSSKYHNIEDDYEIRYPPYFREE